MDIAEPYVTASPSAVNFKKTAASIGNDLVTWMAAASVGRDANFSLRDGDNALDVEATIGDDLSVVSTNEDDVVTIGEEATIVGTTDLGLGGQTDEGGGRHRGRGRGGRC